MAHNIMNETKFYSLRIPAWHNLGYVSDMEQSILEVASIVGIPEVTEQDIYYQDANGLYVPMPGYKVIHGSTPENGTQPYCVVSRDYHTVTHSDIVQACYRTFEAKPIETLGLLGKGERMFLSYSLPNFQVYGDNIQAYLMVMNPITGCDSLTARTTLVRVVCKNTLMLALNRHTERQINLSHRTNPLPQLMQWLTETEVVLTTGLADVQSLAEALAVYKPTPDEVQSVLDASYPLPSWDDDTKPTDEMLYSRDVEQAHRDIVIVLWNESPTVTQATQGTAWGLYNAVAEYEQFGRKRATDRSAMFGEGARRTLNAYKAVASLVGV